MLRSLVRPLLAERSTSQLALAIALGISIGIIPKLNLIAVAWLMTLFLSRANLLVGLIVATCSTFAGLVVDPYLHQFGELLLASDVLRPLFKTIYQLPLGPWTCINNTVVVAAFIVGLLQFIPTYVISRAFFANRIHHLQDHWLVKATRTEASTGWRI